MTWNEISDGQPGLALPAMQNWRHAGRFALDMVPLDTDGSTLTTGLLNLGTANAPWANAYIATGGSIYVGGTAFEGGGGGSAVEVFEQQSHLEKSGYFYPLSNPQSLNESFVDSNAMVITLGKTHNSASTTIYLDRDAISISAINEASLTAWTPVNTGTTATNTTAGQSVDGTSVKYAVTATNTTYYMAMSFTAFSLVEQDLKVWLYPDTVSNLTAAMIRLYSAATTTGYAEWQIPVASLTAGTLNSLYINVDSPDTTGADYVRASINYVALGLIGTTTPQAVEWSWDKLRSVDNRKLKLPVQVVCDNATNQEFINIVSTTVGGDVYLLDTTTTYSHTISSTEIKLKQLTIDNNQATINTSSSGDAALTGWDISRQYFDTVTSGDLILTSRWYDESYRVATLTNASTTVLSITTSTVAAGFKSGDVVRLYKWEYIDQDYQSPYNASIGSNFLDLTLTVDGTATSSQLTLVHGNTSNQNLGGDDVSTWRGVRVSIDDYYRVESNTQSQSLTKATTNVFIPKDDGIVYFDGVSAHWKLDNDGGTTQIDSFANYNLVAVGTPTKVKGKFDFAASGFVSNTAYYRNFYSQLEATAGASSKFTVECWVKFVSVAAGTFQVIFLNTNNTYTEVTGALALAISSATVFGIGDPGLARYSSVNAQSYEDGEWHYVVGLVDSASLSGTTKWLYIDGVNVGTIQNSADTFTAADGYLTIGGSATASRNWKGSIDDLVYWHGIVMTETQIQQRYAKGRGRKYSYSPGYIQKSSIAVSGSKLIHGARVTRQDATNQNPIIYQKNAVIT